MDKQKEWFEDWFDELYLQLYSHRDCSEAEHFLKLLQKLYPQKMSGTKLDLACGAGRHSFFLKESFPGEVFSLDLSRSLLNVATEQTSGSGDPYLVQGDIRQLPFKSTSFDLILNMFTSFGYFSNDELLFNTLREIHRILADNGLFILDLMNKKYTIRNLVDHDEVFRGGYHIHQDRTYEKSSKMVKKRITVFEKGHQIRDITESVRVFDLEEISKMLLNAGFTLINTLGDYNNPVYDKENSKRMIVISGK